MKYQENELVMLILGLGVLVFFLFFRRRVMRIPGAGILLAAFIALVVAYVLTILEGYYLPDAANLGEHICYAANSLLIAWYAWRVFGRKEAP